MNNIINTIEQIYFISELVKEDCYNAGEYQLVFTMDNGITFEYDEEEPKAWYSVHMSTSFETEIKYCPNLIGEVYLDVNKPIFEQVLQDFFSLTKEYYEDFLKKLGLSNKTTIDK